MIYLHGYGIGYRQRVHTRQQDVGTKDKPKMVDEAGMESGTVRDIEVDHMEEQLDAVNAAATAGGGRPMVAVMPQGRYTAQLGPQFGAAFLSEAFLDKAFGKVPALTGVKRGRAMLAGHSGAGGTLTPLLGKAVDERGQLKGGAEQEAAGLPKNLAEVVLFDALNSPRQRKNVETWLTANIRRDLRELAALPDPKRDEYLTNRLVRFRGYYSSGYAKTYTDLKNNVAAVLKSEIAKAAPRAATRRRVTPGSGAAGTPATAGSRWAAATTTRSPTASSSA
jgi:hypothetical protein